MVEFSPRYFLIREMINISTKFLALLSLLIVLAGGGLLWFGLKVDVGQVLSNQSSPVELEFVNSGPDEEEVAVIGIDGETALVTKVIDGDTIQIESGQTIRFIGVDTPETVDPRRPVGCFGKEASNEMKGLLSGKTVILQKDVSDTDKYNRLLRYIFLPLEDGQSLFVNDYLLREGFAQTLTYPPDVKYTSQFLEAERSAKENKKGLWGKC